MRICRHHTLLTSFMAGTAVLLAGCGTKAYEDRVEEGMKSLRVAQMFLIVSAARTEIPGTPFTVRLPTFIDGNCKPFNADSAEPSLPGKVNPQRLQPSFLQIPGLRITYEMRGVTDTSEESLYYCYLAAIPQADAVVGGKPLEDAIQTQLAATFGKAQWDDVKCPSQTGPPVDWKYLRAEGNQVFVDWQGTAKTLPGVFELYSKDIDGMRVMIGWRYQQKLNQAITDPAKLTAGSIVGTGPAEPGAAAPAPAAD